jgi:hypothetical protein
VLSLALHAERAMNRSDGGSASSIRRRDLAHSRYMKINMASALVPSLTLRVGRQMGRPLRGERAAMRAVVTGGAGSIGPRLCRRVLSGRRSDDPLTAYEAGTAVSTRALTGGAHP